MKIKRLSICPVHSMANNAAACFAHVYAYGRHSLSSETIFPRSEKCRKEVNEHYFRLPLFPICPIVSTHSQFPSPSNSSPVVHCTESTYFTCGITSFDFRFSLSLLGPLFFPLFISGKPFPCAITRTNTNPEKKKNTNAMPMRLCWREATL